MSRPNIAFVPSRPTPELQPPCSVCGNPMWLTRLSAYSDSEELQTFRCHVCERSETKIVLKASSQ